MKLVTIFVLFENRDYSVISPFNDQVVLLCKLNVCVSFKKLIFFIFYIFKHPSFGF